MEAVRSASAPGQLLLVCPIQVEPELEALGDQVQLRQTSRKGIVRHQPQGRHALGAGLGGVPYWERVQPCLDMKRNILKVEILRQREAGGADEHLILPQVNRGSGQAPVFRLRQERHLCSGAGAVQVRQQRVAAVVDHKEGLRPEIPHLPPRTRNGLLYQFLGSGGVRTVLQGLGHQNVVRIPDIQRLLRPQVQAQRPGHRHQHHAGQNTDIGKAHGRSASSGKAGRRQR